MIGRFIKKNFAVKMFESKKFDIAKLEKGIIDTLSVEISSPVKKFLPIRFFDIF